MTPAPNSPRYRMRLALGIILALPVPLILVTLVALATSDFRHTPNWAKDWMLYAIPLVSIFGFAILPIQVWKRVVLACVVVPLICLLTFIWTLVFVCYAFNDCIKSLV